MNDPDHIQPVSAITCYVIGAAALVWCGLCAFVLWVLR